MQHVYCGFARVHEYGQQPSSAGSSCYCISRPLLPSRSVKEGAVLLVRLYKTTLQHVFVWSTSTTLRCSRCICFRLAQAKANGMDELSLRDGRYDGIFHLVTAARGAEENYSLDNNEARTESVEVARDVRCSI